MSAPPPAASLKPHQIGTVTRQADALVLFMGGLSYSGADKLMDGIKRPSTTFVTLEGSDHAISSQILIPWFDILYPIKLIWVI